jgi:hypothetical protein
MNKGDLKMSDNELLTDKDVIYKYTCDQAIEDGVLTDITGLNPKWKDGLFNFVTNNLLSKGYINEGEKQILNVPAITDLLQQSILIVKKESENFKKQDWFYSGKIELPNGTKQKIFIQQNETGKYTIMLPEDY